MDPTTIFSQLTTRLKVLLSDVARETKTVDFEARVWAANLQKISFRVKISNKMQVLDTYLKVEGSELVIGPKLAAVKTSRLRFFKSEHDAGREILAEFSFIPRKPPKNSSN
jgi:hypothetical protein